MESRHLGIAVGLAAFLCATSPILAADYYFDSVGGDDAADGKTEATAKKTFKMPSGAGHTVYLKRGSSWTGNLSANNVTAKAYGTGNRPEFIGTMTLSKATVEGVAARPPADPSATRAVNCINVMSDSNLIDCEADGGGTPEHVINVGIGVMGTNNRILHNYVHDLAWSQSGGQMDNSGGAEGIMVMASNNEIGWNSAVRCWSSNATLGGMEGGCYEIVNGKAGSTISNVSFHHNYCELSIGMWEGCSGDFSATGGGIQENHGIIENVTISYNVAVDSMWLFLLQPVNTDFKNVVFANNTLIHTANSAASFDKSPFHYSMGNAVATYTNSASGVTYDTDNEFYKKGVGFQMGTIIVKNNIFIDDVGATRYQMFSTSFLDHSNNLFVPANASVGSITLDATEKKLNLADLALGDVYRLTAQSTAAIDKGVVVNMTTNATLASAPADQSFFPGVFTQDYDQRSVPCGAGVDIGASEYCTGAAGAPGQGGAGGASGGSGAGGAGTTPRGSGGAAGTSGSKGTGGTTAATGSGGTTSTPGSDGTTGTGGATAGTTVATGSGGTTSTPGSDGTTGTGGATADTTDTGTGSGQKGCSCSLGRGDGTPSAFALATLLGLLALLRGRRASAR
jgi:MYXO-CTERM domain-containing protein